MSKTYQVQIAEASTGIGIGMVKMIAHNLKYKDPIPENSMSIETNVVLDKIKYRFKKHESQIIGLDIAEDNSKLVVGITAFGLLTGGTAALPVAIAAMFVNNAIDKSFGALMDSSEEQAITFLYKHEQAIIQRTGLSIKEISKKSADEIEKTLDKIPEIEQALIDRHIDTETAKKFAKQISVTALKNIAISSHEKLRQQEDNFDKFVEGTLDFRSKINTHLKEHAERIGILGVKVENLNLEVNEVKQISLKNSKDIGFIKNFAFSNMSAKEKIYALNSGMMDHMLKDDPDAKNTLIRQYEKEAEIDELKKDVGRAITHLSSLDTIATNLGISTKFPIIGESLNLAITGMNTYTQVLSGNYLAAVSIVSGLFSKGKPDTAAIRHRQMMEYLQKQFEQINKKLDVIIENQKKIYEAIGKVSQQVQDVYLALDGRLDRMEFELLNIDRKVEYLINREWEECASIYYELYSNAEKYNFDISSLSFKSVSGIIELREQGMDNTAHKALDRVHDTLTTFSDSDIFSNLMGIGRSFMFYREFDDTLSINKPDLNEQSREAIKKRLLDKSHQQRYIDYIKSTDEVLHHFHFKLKENGIEENRTIRYNLYSRLSVPVLSVYDTYPQTSNFEDANNILGNSFDLLNNLSLNQLDDLIFAGSDGSSQVDPQIALRLAEWMYIVIYFADIRYPTDEDTIPRYVRSSEELLNAVREDTTWTEMSIKLLKKLESLISCCIVSHSKLFGMPAVEAVVNILKESSENKELKKKALELLQFNPYLANNVVIYLLVEASKHSDRTSIQEHTYNFLIGVVNENPEEFKKMLTGPDAFAASEIFEFIYDEDEKSVKWPFVRIKSEEIYGQDVPGDLREIKIPMPNTKSFIKGSLEYPISLYKLIDFRERVRNRLLEYSIFQNDDIIEENYRFTQEELLYISDNILYQSS